MIIKTHKVCSGEKTYDAQVGSLPPAFVDGSQGSGPEGSLYIEEVLPDQHIVIHARFIGVTIIIRQVGGYLTLAMKMPKELVQTWHRPGLELCVKGCPASEQIDFQAFLSRSGKLGGALEQSGTSMSAEEAISKCRENNVTDFYFDSCVFDLITTGDAKFSDAASTALRDILTLSPDAASSHENRTFLNSASCRTIINMYRLSQILLSVIVMLLVHC